MAFIPPPHAASRPDRKQIVIAADTTNYNLANDLTTNYGWNGTSPIDAQVTINPGVSVSATATTAPAFHADLVSGSTLTLDNHGVIVGKGGSAGSAGGHAISLQDVAATINNIPARNLMSKSEALDHGDWSGHTGITANANSKNIVPWSQKIQSWSNGGTTVVADTLIAPDGTKTMDTIEVNAGSTYQWANRGMWFNVATSTLYTISAFMKHSGSNRTLINFMNPASPYTSLARLYHDWSGGTPTQNSFVGDSPIGTPVLEDVGNDIWRISFQVMSSATATAAGIAIYPNAGFTGNDPVGVWGVQVEQITQSLGTTLVDGASQSGTTLIVDGFTAQPQAGDKFTIAGIAGTFTVSSATTLSSTESTLTIAETLPSSPADDAVVTFTVAAACAKLSAYEETGGSSNPPIANPVDGSATADLWQRSATSGQYTYQYLTKPTIPQTYTVSCYAKRSVGDFFSMRFQGSYPSRADAVFDLNTGTIKTSQLGAHSNFSNASATIDSVGGGWYYCTFTATTDSHNYLYAYISVNSRGRPIDHTDVITNSSAYFWGFQLELTNKNLYINPEDLNGSGWYYAVTLVDDAHTNPVDGAQTATSMVRNASTNGTKREQSVPLIVGQTYIHSVYIKNIDATQSALRTWDNANSTFLGVLTLTWGGTGAATPTLTTNASASNAVAEDVGNGWWRVSYQQTTSSGSGVHASGVTPETTSANLGVYVYGFQMELMTADGKPSPYIPVSRNVLDYPQELDKWSNVNCTVASNVLISPDGSLTGDTLVQGTGSTYPQNDSRYQSYSLSTSTVYTVSGFFRHSGSNRVRIYIGDSTTAQIARLDWDWDGSGAPVATPVIFSGASNLSFVDVGGGWHRVSFSFTSHASNSTHFIFINPNRFVPGFDTVGVWGMQIEKGAKNLLTHSEELDNAAWIKPAGSGVAPVVTANANSVNINPYSEDPKTLYNSVQTVTITENVAAAPDGKFTADRIEDTSAATGATQYTQKNLSIPQDTSTWTWSFYILKDSNTSRFPMFAVGLHGGSIGNQHRYCWFNTSTGAFQNGSLNGQNPLTSVVVTSVGDYWRLALTATNNGENNLIYHQIYPAHATSLGGSGNGTPTGSVVFAHSQVQKGSTASAYEPKFTVQQTVKMLAPNGTETVEYIVATDTANRRAYQSPGKPAFAEEYTFSIHVKKSIGDYFALRIQGAWPNRGEAVFNLETGVASTPHYGGATPATGATIESLPNGWFRVSVTFVSDDATSVSGVFAPAITSNTVGGTDSAAGAAAYVWGAQIERGPLTPYEEASGYVAVGNKSTRYQPVDQGVVATLGGLGTSSRTPRILAGGGGGGSGGQVTGNGATEDEQGNCENNGHTLAGGAGGTGAGPGAATGGSSGSGNSGTGSSGNGGSGGSYGVAGSSGSTGQGIGCQHQNHGAGSGGAAGKAVHLISGATLTLRNNGDVLGATS